MSEEPSARFLASIYLTARTQVKHWCSAHRRLQQADRHISTRLIYLGTKELGGSAPTAAHKIRSVKLFLLLLWPGPNNTYKQWLAMLFWRLTQAKDHFQYNPGCV